MPGTCSEQLLSNWYKSHRFSHFGLFYWIQSNHEADHLNIISGLIETWGFREDLNPIVLHHYIDDNNKDNNDNDDNDNNNDDNNDDDGGKFTKTAITQSIFELQAWNFAW